MPLTKTNDFDCEVLIIGAGPTGLMAAALLQRCGVRVRIVDKRLAASNESRAFVLAARSLELCLNLGLADAVLDQAMVNTTIDLFVSGKRVGGFDYDLAGSPDTPFQFMGMLPQSKTERVLIDDLAGRGIQVERGIDVSGFEQDAAGVTASGKRADGGVDVCCAYVIGADGAYSVVRHTLGLTFEGAKYGQSFLLADCHVDWPWTITASACSCTASGSGCSFRSTASERRGSCRPISVRPSRPLKACRQQN